MLPASWGSEQPPALCNVPYLLEPKFQPRSNCLLPCQLRCWDKGTAVRSQCPSIGATLSGLAVMLTASDGKIKVLVPQCPETLLRPEGIVAGMAQQSRRPHPVGALQVWDPRVALSLLSQSPAPTVPVPSLPVHGCTSQPRLKFTSQGSIPAHCGRRARTFKGGSLGIPGSQVTSPTLAISASRCVTNSAHVPLTLCSCPCGCRDSHFIREMEAIVLGAHSTRSLDGSQFFTALQLHFLGLCHHVLRQGQD